VRILIAEDDGETADFVQRGLEQLGHNPVVAANGADALHLLSTEQFDVAVVDRMLPSIDGLSVLRRIRAASIELPVLLLTALGRIEDRVTGLEAGADDYLVKPFAFSEFAAVFDAALVRTSRVEPAGHMHGIVICDGGGRKGSRNHQGWGIV
jgi:two-component system OmpR family response regulator